MYVSGHEVEEDNWIIVLFRSSHFCSCYVYHEKFSRYVFKSFWFLFLFPLLLLSISCNS